MVTLLLFIYWRVRNCMELYNRVLQVLMGEKLPSSFCGNDCDCNVVMIVSFLKTWPVSPSPSYPTAQHSSWRHSNEVKVIQSCLCLCDPMDYTGHGILQDRILEWVAFPVYGDLPNPETKPRSPTLQVDSLPAEPQGKPSWRHNHVLFCR